MFCAFLSLIFILMNSSLINAAAGQFNKVLDNFTITLSLEDYNVSSPEGVSYDSLYTLQPHSISEIVLTKIPKDVHFVVVQVHSYLVNVTLSLDSVPQQSNSITATNVGLLKMAQKSDLSFYLTYNSSSEEADILVSVQAYSKDAPIPGGCNMEFQVEISPFLLTTYNEFMTEVDFAPSAPPLSILSKYSLFPNTECNLKPSPVQHKMYYQYFPERDFTKDTYFSILKTMMTKGRILENAVLVPEKLRGSSMKRFFATYPGTGNAFVVVSNFENHTSVYVPSFTYGCNDLEDNNTCLVLTTTFSKVLCATVLFMGLFACFCGHYFFRIEIFLFGLLASGLVTYILVSILFTSSIALSTSVSFGFFAATSMLVAWTIFGLPIISLILATLTFGFLLASVIYYPIIDFVDLLVLDINFWGIFIGILVTCPVLMLCLAEKANIISCAFLGSYVGIMSIDHYLGSNLRYIVINIIRRAVAKGFNFAVIGPPFQWKDALLCLAWAVSMFLGIAVQRLLMKNKPPYPPPVNLLRNIYKKWKSFSSFTNQPNEISPLLMDRPSNGDSVLTPPNYTSYDGNYIYNTPGSTIRT